MPKALRAGALALMGALLSSTTVFLGVGPMLAHYRGLGRVLFFAINLPLLGALVATGQVGIWAPFAASALLVVVFSEDQRAGGSVIRSGALACISVVVVGFGAAAVWINQTGFAWLEALKAALHESILQMGLGSKMAIDESALLIQMPSALVIGVIVALWFGVLFERRIRLTMGMPQDDVTSGLRLAYRLPDAAVWVLILAVGGAFVEMGQPQIQSMALNLFNVMVLLYFFQGLSVVATFFKLNRTGYLWRALGYFFLTVQLFLVVGFLGLLDYWFNFRDKMLRKSMETV